MSEDIEKPGNVDKISALTPLIRLPQSMSSAGMYYQPPGCDPHPSALTEGREVVEVMTGGRGWVQQGEEWREVLPGTLLWHLPGERTITRSDWENPYRCFAIRFEMNGPSRPRFVPRFTQWNDLEEVMRFAKEVIRWWVDESFDREALLQYVHGRVLFQAQLWERQRQSELPPRLMEALELMKLRIEEPLPLQKIAKQVGWSPSHLHEIFRQHLGITPHRFLLERRIRRAKERLVVTNDSVKEIAAASGFSSAAAFCHAFRQHVGTTPLDYRRQMVPGAQ